MLKKQIFARSTSETGENSYLCFYFIIFSVHSISLTQKKYKEYLLELIKKKKKSKVREKNMPHERTLTMKIISRKL